MEAEATAVISKVALRADEVMGAELTIVTSEESSRGRGSHGGGIRDCDFRGSSRKRGKALESAFVTQELVGARLKAINESATRYQKEIDIILQERAVIVGEFLDLKACDDALVDELNAKKQDIL
ncbi:hypothetical protein AMTR_s00037p00152460 [Amborella trichopoda]|uniref:Uncharacterized protein n=1 Tax=Amborella trichopoda TaxID=13333 RepID=U5D7G2_AMBTC|nr:hypothetical protein AMTR_s00037p00152460 [Amborella trichopoda]